MSSLSPPIICHIDSDKRESGSHSDFIYKLPKLSEKYNRMCLLEASIPKSYYFITSGKNTFTLDENGMEYTVTLAIGNYDIRSFATALKTALDLAGSYSYTVTVEDISAVQTGKISYSVSGNGGIQPKFIFPSSSILWKPCGFDSESTNTFSGDALTSSNVVNFSIGSLLINCDCVFTGSNKLGSSTLGMIPTTTTPDFAYISWYNSVPYWNSYEFKHKDDIRIWFTDLDDNELNLNGLSVNLTVCFFEWDNSNALSKAKNIINLYEGL